MPLCLSLICDKPRVVSGTEGQTFDFRCEYPNNWNNKSKYFCCFDFKKSFAQLVRTSNHNEWTTAGRVSLYDNATASFFIVRVDKLSLNDSGMYWWGADGSDHIKRIDLNVSPEVTLQLFLTMILCIGAMMFVCLFTICLLLAAKKRRSTPQQRREVGLHQKRHSNI
ncbi:hypothetical protein XENOCAPTIV_029902 [Xenoophorus captivus]|uniref:Immunoglobulin V-set domain-containing protein n=1 Tax=Xenoophorus captivus TaxID=1517983 RepID=A0ABV0RYH2_9TELE